MQIRFQIKIGTHRDAVVEANTALPLCVVEELLVGTASVDRADEEVVPLVVTVVAELLFGVVVTADPVTAGFVR
jgi:hypothetical protein